MKESFAYSAPGLEVDSRNYDQTEKIANTRQINGAHEAPVSQYSEPSAWQSSSGSSIPVSKVQHPEERREQRRRLVGAVPWLLVALGVAVAAAVIAAAVGGSIAASRARKLSSCNTDNQHLQYLNEHPVNWTNAPSINCPNNTTSNNTLPSHPNSDCTSYNGGFTAYDGTKYRVSCNQDLKSDNYGPDIIGIFVYTMRDCMAACSSFNTNGAATNGTCYSVAVNWNIDPTRGNCWLKSVANIPSSTNNGVDSAVLITS